MDGRRGRYILNVLLLAAAVVVVLTGLLVDQLDLNEFTAHRWAGYVVAVLIVIHVGLRWRWFLPSRGVDRRRREPEPSVLIHPPAEPANLPFVAEPQTGAAVGATASGGGAGTARAAPGRAKSHPSRRVAITAMGAGVAGVVVGWAAKSGVSPDPYPGGDVGLFYHRQSSLGLRGLLSDLVDWGRRPAPYLRVGDAAVVALPAVGSPPDMSVAQALEQRRSLREYADRAMTAEELAWVIHAATGITSTQGYRAAPSAGALYPVETYVAVSRVEGIDPGSSTSTSGARRWSRYAAGRSPATSWSLASARASCARPRPCSFSPGCSRGRAGSTARATTGMSAGRVVTWLRTSTSRPRPPVWERAWWARSSTAWSTTWSVSTGGTRPRSVSSPSDPDDDRATTSIPR